MGDRPCQNAVDVLKAEKVWNSDLLELAAEVYRAPGTANLIDAVGSLRIPGEGNRRPTLGEAQVEFVRLLDLSAAAEALDLIKQAGAKTKCRFDLDYTAGPNMQLPHLADLRALARFLNAVSATLAEQGNADAAGRCLIQQFELANCLRDGPILISQLVRVALAAVASTSLRITVNWVDLSSKHMDEVNRLLRQLGDRAPWATALDGERLLLGEWVFNQPLEAIKTMLRTAGNALETPKLDPEIMARERIDYNQALMRAADLMGAPFHYGRKGDGFVLYSVGPDGNDDGVAKAQGTPGKYAISWCLQR